MWEQQRGLHPCLVPSTRGAEWQHLGYVARDCQSQTHRAAAMSPTASCWLTSREHHCFFSLPKANQACNILFLGVFVCLPCLRSKGEQGKACEIKLFIQQKQNLHPENAFRHGGEVRNDCTKFKGSHTEGRQSFSICYIWYSNTENEWSC